MVNDGKLAFFDFLAIESGHVSPPIVGIHLRRLFIIIYRLGSISIVYCITHFHLPCRLNKQKKNTSKPVKSC